MKAGMVERAQGEKYVINVPLKYSFKIWQCSYGQKWYKMNKYNHELKLKKQVQTNYG